MIHTVVPSNREMAGAINVVASLLLDAHILTDEGLGSMQNAATRLHQKAGKDWSYTTPPAEPIRFEPCFDRAGRRFVPIIGVDRIEVKDEPEKIPFVRWDLNLLLEFEDSEVHCPRWHFDLCNPGQDGPITHLQYGGNKHFNRPNLDVRIREPRWHLPPLDLILMCETVAANFFPIKWQSSLKDERKWNLAIQQSQKLCFPFYFRAMHNALNNGEVGSLLRANWNS